MVRLDNSRGVLLVLLSAVVLSSGCIESSSTNLNPDFNLDVNTTSANSSGMEIYRTSMSRAGNVSTYRVEADNSMAMNLPVVGLSLNMTSKGLFEKESYDINSSGVMGFNFGEETNFTEFNTRVMSLENDTKVEKEAKDRENQTKEQYSREDLGLSLEALEDISVENASVLGIANHEGEENLLLELNINSSDLIRNSEKIFEVHSPVQESAGESGDMSEAEKFDKVEAYLWAERETRNPSKFAYYGSAKNGSIQVRSETEFENIS